MLENIPFIFNNNMRNFLIVPKSSTGIDFICNTPPCQTSIHVYG